MSILLPTSQVIMSTSANRWDIPMFSVDLPAINDVTAPIITVAMNAMTRTNGVDANLVNLTPCIYQGDAAQAVIGDAGKRIITAALTQLVAAGALTTDIAAAATAAIAAQPMLCAQVCFFGIRDALYAADTRVPVVS